jgi:hypothetical protein
MTVRCNFLLLGPTSAKFIVIAIILSQYIKNKGQNGSCQSKNAIAVNASSHYISSLCKLRLALLFINTKHVLFLLLLPLNVLVFFIIKIDIYHQQITFRIR